MNTKAKVIREKVRKAFASQKQPTVTVLSTLLVVQEQLGYIPAEAIEEVADQVGSTVNDVWAVASFYTNFRFSPPAKHIFEMCWGPTCHIANAMNILKTVHETLSMTGEGETSDGRLTVKYNTCLGACSQAPVISIDHRIIGRVSPDSVVEMLSQLDGTG